MRPQPFGDAETLQGARNRAWAATRLHPDAHFCVGIEGGVAEVDGEMLSFSWVCIVSGTIEGKSRTAAFLLPAAVAALVRQGAELSAACDFVFQRANTSRSEGAVGLLTGGVIDRTLLYEPAVVLALVPFRNRDLFPHQTVSTPPAAG
ncbi:MAG TPA: inosine/xanthosine triphosphatase [Longimicrobiaceae bacterium]|nr:inosine/xanthosine triphosphatase [Longimicrobiaceae bacterium]